MTLDLTALSNAIVSLEAALTVISNREWFDAQSAPVRDTLVAGVIQNVEFVYELSIKMLRRRIDLDAASPTEADFGDFRSLLRLGAERRLIADTEAWLRHRNMRDITPRAYDRAKAQDILERAPSFLDDARDLLSRLKARDA